MSTNVTVTTAAAFIPEIWLAEIQYALVAKLEFRNLAHIVFGPGKKGDTIHMGTINFGTARDKVANTEIVFDATTDTDTSLVLNKDKYKAILVEDIAKIQAEIDLVQAKVLEVTYPVSKAMDVDLASLYSGISNSVDAGAMTASTAVGKLLELKRTMDTANAPREGRVLVVEPYTESILLETDKMTSRDYIVANGGSPLSDGAIGRFLGFEIIPSNNIQESGSKYQNLAFVKDRTLGLGISLDLAVEYGRVIQHLSNGLVAHMIYGVGVREADSGCKFLVTVPGE